MKKLLTIFLVCSSPVWAELKLQPSEGSMKVLDGDKLITEYRTDWKVPYLYPLTSPSGAIISRHWPTDPSIPEEQRDHPHHRSMWMGHGSVNGADFWGFMDDQNAHIVHKGFSGEGTANGASTFAASLEWIAQDKKLLDEKRMYTVRKIDEKTTAVEIESTLVAAEDVVFGDTKEGMIAFRMDRTLRLKGKQAKSHIIDSEGHTDNETWGKRAKWVAYTGPDELGKPVVAAFFDHPSSFRHPTYWHVRDYGLVAANPFGVHDFEGKKDQPKLGDHTLKKGEKLTFKYSIVIHEGDLKTANLEKIWENFSKN